ncbi:MAG: hypothetical protein ABSA02_20020 [Trebonia sp.]
MLFPGAAGRAIGAALITVVSYRVLLIVIAVAAAASGLFVIGRRHGTAGAQAVITPP